MGSTDASTVLDSTEWRFFHRYAEGRMPRISAERGEATRRRILDAARTVFTERGFHAASIDDVVRVSGLSVGAIYTHFTGKDELVRLACLDAINDAVAAVMTDLRAPGTVGQKLDRAIDAWFDGFASDPSAPSFLAQAWASAAEIPAIRDMLIRRRERIVTVATMLLREGAETGELRPDLDVDRLARGFAALLDGLLLERLEERGGQDPDQARREILAFVRLLYRDAAGAA